MKTNELKFNLLSTFEKREVMDFIVFLYSKTKKAQEPNLKNYKKKIVAVSIWTDDDLKIFEENSDKFNQWQPETW